MKRLTCSCGLVRTLADVDVERQFLLQQVVGDGVDAEFLRQFGLAPGQRQDDVVGLVFLLQQRHLPQHRLG